jgi:hypothetical protein
MGTWILAVEVVLDILCLELCKVGDLYEAMKCGGKGVRGRL